LDYYTSGGTAGCPALLVEPAATNLALRSRDLSNVIWVKTSITAAKNAVGADGTASGATTLTATAASGTVLQALVNVSQSRVFSAYIRRVSGTGAIQLTTNGGTNWDTVTISSLYTQVFCTAQTVLNGSVGIRMAVSGDVIEVDFTQGEVGPVATSPIATTTAAVTRNADVISLSGAVSGCIGQTEGTIYWEGDASLVSGGNDILFINRNITNSVVLFKGATNLINARVHASGAAALTISDTVSRTGFLKIAVAYKSGDSTLYINGARAGTLNTTAFTFTAALNTIRFGDDTFLLGRGDQRCRAVAVYSTRLTDSELAALTTP
jgi:hypothetical protein